MRVLITGITGFVGSYLAEYALSQNAQVYGSFRWRSRTENIDQIKDQVEVILINDASTDESLKICKIFYRIFI